ncbi:hypothetical protein [Streptomyces sp. H51]|uniref:hypothetical protein n=1 Tax=Streptomyces sp. H51 TaxID=3111770 RepID=UPI002D79173A|nr:hypothetical protein [Streptomyces sp. H51]
MAIDPARIRKRAIEAEQSGRRLLSVDEAEQALRALAVVVEQEQPSGDPVVLQAS